MKMFNGAAPRKVAINETIIERHVYRTRAKQASLTGAKRSYLFKEGFNLE